MNNSFLEFITQDIESKKEILSSMPTKTKTNIKKYNEFILDIEKKYNEYRSSTRNYLLAKAKAFQINEEPKEDKLSEKIENLEYIKFLLNPTNTYVEKMGLDTLLYQISNYYTLNFNGNLVYFKTEEERDNFLKQYDNPLIETAKKKIKK